MSESPHVRTVGCGDSPEKMWGVKKTCPSYSCLVVAPPIHVQTARTNSRQSCPPPPSLMYDFRRLLSLADRNSDLGSWAPSQKHLSFCFLSPAALGNCPYGGEVRTGADPMFFVPGPGRDPNQIYRNDALQKYGQSVGEGPAPNPRVYQGLVSKRRPPVCIPLKKG
jgi:hypothetical protein